MPTEPATATMPTAMTTTATTAMLIDAPSNDFALAGEFAMLACACLCGLWLLRMIVSRRSHLGREPSNASVASGCVPLLLPAPLLQRPPLSALPADPWLGARHPGGPRLPQPTNADKTVNPWLGARSPLPLPVLVCPPLPADPWRDARRPGGPQLPQPATLDKAMNPWIGARSPSPLPRPALPSPPLSALPEDPWFMHSATAETSVAATATTTTTTTVTSAATATATTTTDAAPIITNVTILIFIDFNDPCYNRSLHAGWHPGARNNSMAWEPTEGPGLGNPLKHLGLRTLKTSHQQQRRALSGGNLAPPPRQWLGNQFEEPGLGNPLKHLGLRTLKTSTSSNVVPCLAATWHHHRANGLGTNLKNLGLGTP
ncbi:hypothetical protein DM01DRAFT_1345933 [Hesseltinella vesiculosa]|uniref:Uncharacterized protein n=1 Tax=Hesseltinella vesiculosa TaxID=101127 RepID=A0A1X2GHR6_9FUNG|nr:hypothetical protein DM01DRAFT_1345933 [Hesseltinella vesiculosa]